jgi:NACHT conflict system protein
MDGLDLATAIAKAEPDPEVKATVIDALAFRRADRHVVEVLTAANEQVFDLICSKGVVNHVSDADVQARLQAAHERQRKGGITHTQRLRSIINAELDAVHAAEVTAVVAQMEIDRKLDADRHLLYEVRQRYPRALAEGLLDRLRHGRTLFYGADDVLASADYALEEEPLLDIALADTRRNDDRAEAAASVLGPLAVRRMVEACLQARKLVRDTNGRYDQAASERYNELRSRMGHTPAASLMAAVQKHAATTDNAEITELADLLCRPTPYDDERGRPFSQDALTAIQGLVQDWAERMLASGDAAHRSQTATIATLISHAPSASLLPLLKRLLDDNLHRYRAFRAEAKATGWRPGKAKTEAQWPNTHQYQQAFMAIKAPETAELMKTYLTDLHFGSLAAAVLASHWIDAHEPKDNRRFRSDVDFTRLEERRAARAADPTVTSHAAEAIFGAIETLIADGSTDDQRRLAVALGVIAARLPHGQRQSTIDKLIALTPRRSRAALLLNLLLSGESIAIGRVVTGIAETFEAAKNETWILTQSDGYELREWLRLLPFVDHPLQALAVIRGMPGQQRNPRLLEQMVSGLGVSPSPEAEELLLKLAEDGARFYANHTWRDAILQRGTLTAARRFIDLAAQGALEAQSTDAWHLARQIAGLMRTHPELRSHVYALLTATPRPPASALLMRAFAENRDADSLLLLIAFESEQKRALVDWRALEHVVTTHVPSEHWVGAYDVVPVPAVELRKRLLELLPGNDSNHPAARCLNNIDKIRDHYGAPESEPRHPNLASGRAWPIITPDSDAEGE